MGHVGRMNDMRNVYIILVGKREGKTARGTHRREWGNHIGGCGLY